MVKNITSLTRDGLRDWLLQRISAIIVGVYVIFVIGFVFLHPQLDYKTWQQLFNHILMRISTLMVLLAITIHAYIGMWTISTDYIKNTAVRLLFQVFLYLSLVAFLLWGVVILWRV